MLRLCSVLRLERFRWKKRKGEEKKFQFVPPSGMRLRDVRKFANDIARGIILARDELGRLCTIESDQRTKVSERYGTYSPRGIKDTTGRASNDGTSELGSALPNNLREVRVLWIVWIILRGFRVPVIYSIGDGVTTTSSGSQVLCVLGRKHFWGEFYYNDVPPYCPTCPSEC